MPKKPISEQVVVVTGASSGLGRAVARRAGERGAKVGLAARNREALENGVGEIPDGLAVPTDVTDLAQCRTLVERTLERYGRIDTFVANAMVTVYAEVEELEPDELRRVMEVNFIGVANCY